MPGALVLRGRRDGPARPDRLDDRLGNPAGQRARLLERLKYLIPGRGEFVASPREICSLTVT